MLNISMFSIKEMLNDLKNNQECLFIINKENEEINSDLKRGHVVFNWVEYDKKGKKTQFVRSIEENERNYYLGDKLIQGDKCEILEFYIDDCSEQKEHDQENVLFILPINEYKESFDRAISKMK